MHLPNVLSTVPLNSTAPVSDSTGSSQNSTAASNNALNGSSFMTLLSAELQNQDPTNPMDPTEFVSQLVQLSELQSTMQIQQSVSQLVSLATPSQSSGTGSQS